MIQCHDPTCDFAVSDEFHYWLHTKINHTVFQPGHTQVRFMDHVQSNTENLLGFNKASSAAADLVQ